MATRGASTYDGVLTGCRRSGVHVEGGVRGNDGARHRRGRHRREQVDQHTQPHRGQCQPNAHTAQATEGQEQIRAVLPYAGERALLGLPPGSAAFTIERLGRANGQRVEWRHTLVRGDRFVVTADLAFRPRER
jgi:hypothetical protein